jgi:hypothetical protein
MADVGVQIWLAVAVCRQALGPQSYPKLRNPVVTRTAIKGLLSLTKVAECWHFCAYNVEIIVHIHVRHRFCQAHYVMVIVLRAETCTTRVFEQCQNQLLGLLALSLQCGSEVGSAEGATDSWSPR